MTCSSNPGKDGNVFLPREAEVILANKMTATETHFKLRMKDGSIFHFEPGQIVEAGLYGYGEIPLGLSSSPTQTDSFDLVVRSVGRVSSALAAVAQGGTITIRGPLGHGFPLNELRGKDILVVAGGIGLCPTRSMIRYILARRSEFKKFTLFFGAKSPKDMLFKEDVMSWRDSSDVQYLDTVDRGEEGWKGNVGVITTLFQKAKDIGPETRAIICGPPIMYKFVLIELSKLGIPDNNIFVDLERRMKCGLGKCGHCQINDKYVCLDGPVFKFADIRQMEEAI